MTDSLDASARVSSFSGDLAAGNSAAGNSTSHQSATSQAACWKNLVKILCVRLDAMGDVLCTEPAMRALKECNPNSRVTLLTTRRGARAASLCASVDEVILFDAPWVKDGDDSEGPKRFGEEALVASLRERGFDAAVIFTPFDQSALPAALLVRMAGVPLALGHSRENPHGLLTHWVPEIEPSKIVRHEVRRQLELVAHVGCFAADERIRVEVSGHARERIDRLLFERGLKGREFILAHPGAGSVSRRYPAEKFGRAVAEVAGDWGVSVVVTGLEAERDLVETVGRESAPYFAAAFTDLSSDELAELIARAKLVVSNNTSVVHVAAGRGTPIVDLYALTHPQQTPWMVPHRTVFKDVECRNCFKDVCPEGHGLCLKGVEPSQVAEAASSLLCELGFEKGDEHLPSPFFEVRERIVRGSFVQPPLDATRGATKGTTGGTTRNS